MLLAACAPPAPPSTSAAPAPRAGADAEAGDPRPDVLVVLLDDLGSRIGCLGEVPRAITPNIDRLAARGVLFTNAHCAGPKCNPARAALLSGMRPTQTGVYTNDDDWKKHIRAGLGLTVPFDQAGYRVVAAGKVAHGSRHYGSEWDDYEVADADDDREVEQDGLLHPAATDVTDQEMPDWEVVEFGREHLRAAKKKPLFLVCGLRAPHLPWSVPQKYYDLYAAADVPLPPHLADDLDDVPATGVRFADPLGKHRKVLQHHRWQPAVVGYLAAVACADASVGRLLEALDQSPRRDNTIVVLVGDHGFHLGEKAHWGNGTLWEECTRVPLVVVAPGVAVAGGRCDAPVETVSVFATLCALAGLPVPAHVEPRTLLPLLRDPKAAWDGHALTSFGYGNDAVRTARWRYIRYADGGEELYDHAADPHEWHNLAGDAGLGAVKAELGALLPRDAVRPGARPWGKK